MTGESSCGRITYYSPRCGLLPSSSSSSPSTSSKSTNHLKPSSYDSLPHRNHQQRRISICAPSSRTSIPSRSARQKLSVSARSTPTVSQYVHLTQPKLHLPTGLNDAACMEVYTDALVLGYLREGREIGYCHDRQEEVPSTGRLDSRTVRLCHPQTHQAFPRKGHFHLRR